MTIITLDLPDELARKLQRLDGPTLIERLQTLFPEGQADTPSIQTLGDLLQHGFALWQDRDDIDDSLTYATQLRQATWQRQSF